MGIGVRWVNGMISGLVWGIGVQFLVHFIIYELAVILLPE